MTPVRPMNLVQLFINTENLRWQILLDTTPIAEARSNRQKPVAGLRQNCRHSFNHSDHSCCPLTGREVR
jgi:hypothetical protein